MLSSKMQSATYTKADVLAVAHTGAPYVSTYPWSTEGFGTKFANPTSTDLTSGVSVAFHPRGNAIATAGGPLGPGISVYPWDGLGFGTKYTSPTTAVSTYETVFSPAGDAIFVGLIAYAWSSAGFGTQYANVLPTSGTIYDVAVNPPGTVFAYCLYTLSPSLGQVGFRRWSAATGFGTAYSYPTSTSAIRAVRFSPDNSAVVISHPTAPYIRAFQWSDAAGIGSQYADPASPLGTTPTRIAFSPNGATVAVATINTPYLAAYAWSGAGFGTRYTNPSSTLATATSVAFNGDGDAVAVTTSSGTQPLAVYSWSAAGFGARFADPATKPVGAGEQVTFLSNTM